MNETIKKKSNKKRMNGLKETLKVKENKLNEKQSSRQNYTI